MALIKSTYRKFLNITLLAEFCYLLFTPLCLNTFQNSFIWLLVPMLTLRAPSISALPVIDRTKIPSFRSATSHAEVSELGQISR